MFFLIKSLELGIALNCLSIVTEF